MFRPAYLSAMGASVGAVAAASCGHPALWVGIGIALGLIWSRLAPEPIEACIPNGCTVMARSWLNQVVALRRVSFVIVLA